jgi:large subunit ribosomal protein L5
MPAERKKREEAAPEPLVEAPAIPRFKERYFGEIVPALQRRFGYRQVMEVPRLAKIVVSMGVGAATQDPKILEAAMADLAIVSGQKPALRRAKRSIASFRLREGNPVGALVTLRGTRMYEFLDRLVNLALPRIRDFRGLSAEAVDGRGNYSLGLREQTVFPEIDLDKIARVQGMNIAIVTTARTDEEALALLREFGLPLRDT